MIGQRLGPYVVTDKIGAGAMGDVFRARDERLGREVALKLLRADDESARRRLEHEARAASSLNHPNICTIYEVGEFGGHLCLAMELVEGRSLEAEIPADGLPESSVVRIGAQLADALEHAHQRGITHRDLKTANVVLTPQGRVKILDFGLAVRTRARLDTSTTTTDSLAASGSVAGTVPYMAPEVLRGQPSDARSDLWALGVILYEMAAGHRPFQGATGFDLTSAILRDPPPPLPERVTPGLGAIVRRCLDKEPSQRYQHGGEVRAALEALNVTASRGPGRPRAGVAPRWGLVAVGVVIVVALLAALGVGNLRERLSGPPASPSVASLAVLPLRNLSLDANEEYFADGMTETLISDLAQISALKVISRTSVMRYRASQKSLPEIARELNVDAVVEGSVARAQDRVRVTAQLVHAATDTTLWARSYERPLSDALKLQSEVAATIAGEIRVRLTPGERERLSAAATVTPAAHDAYLRGRYFWNTRTESGLQRSIQYFQQALDANPGYAAAYAGLADAYALVAGYGPVAPHDAFPRAKAAALRALELDPANAEAHTSLAFVVTIYDFDWTTGRQEFQKAIELNPNYATGHHWYGHYLMFIGRFDDAAAEMARAKELDPLSPIINTEIGYPKFFARQYDRAIDDYRKAIDLDPDFYRTFWLLGQAYEQKGMYEEAIAAIEKAVQLSEGNLVMQAALAHTWALAGQSSRARKVLDQLTQVSSREYFSPYFIAEIHLALGEKDAALRWLERAYEARDYFFRWIAIDPRLDALRSDPRFQTLVRRVNFPS
jgi:serine/threonine protein kinase/tetratricopeptide (TPR) repeat protein